MTASGTAVTARHLDTLQRSARSEQLVIGLDQDAAGQAAAARTVDRAVQRWPETRVVTVAEGYDPADWVASHDDPAAALPPYTDRAQQQPAASWLARQAVQTYFANSRPEHRTEVEGQLGAAHAAAVALANVERTEAIRAGLEVTGRLELVEASHMASMLADARAQQNAAQQQRGQPQRVQAAHAEVSSPPAQADPARDPSQQPQDVSSLAVRARAVREQAQRAAAADEQQQAGTARRRPDHTSQGQQAQQQRQAEVEEQRRREEQRRADEERQRQERDTGLER